MSALFPASIAHQKAAIYDRSDATANTGVDLLKRLVIDIDGTLTQGNTSDYSSVKPREDVVDALRRYHKDGFEIVLHTARNMRTYQSSVGKINAHMLPVLFDWLARHEIPYDEIWTGKPWCGTDGFYVDDKAIRPDEFVKMSYDEIQDLISPDSATTASHSFSD